MIHLLIYLLMVEVWLPVIGYEGLYEVSNLGKVRSVDRRVYQIQKGGKLCPIKRNGRVLRPDRDKGGYERCQLWKDDVGKFKLINRLVAEAFIPNPKNLPQVNHKDENKLNNKVENLEWCSAKYNVNYGTGIQRRSRKIRVDGIEYQSISEAARSLGCRPSTLSWALIHNQTTYKNHKIELIELIE